MSSEIRFYENSSGEFSPTEFATFVEVPVGESDTMFSAWGLKSEEWGEVYAGFGHYLKNWISLTGYIGVEQHEKPWRIAGTLWMGGRGFNSLLNVEDGGSGSWYVYTLTKSVGSRVSVGLFSRRFFGTGPVAEFGLPKSKLWVATTTDKEGGWRAISGLKYSF